MRFTLLLLLFFITGLPGLMAQKISLEDELTKNGFTQFARISKATTVSADATGKNNLLDQLVKSDPTISFKLVPSEKLPGGLVQEKYQLYKNGLKVRVVNTSFISQRMLSIMCMVFAAFETESFDTKSQAGDKVLTAAVDHFNSSHQL